MHSWVFRFRRSLLSLYVTAPLPAERAADPAGEPPAVEPAHAVLRPFAPRRDR